MKCMSVKGGPFKRGVTESVVYKMILDKDIIEGIKKFETIFVIYLSIKVINILIRQVLE